MLVFTSCSFTKRVPVSPALRVSSLRARSLEGTAREWARRINAEQVRVPAGDVYGGQAVVAAKAAAEILGARLHFVSAGLALVDQHSPVPGYDLSIGAGESTPRPLAEGRHTPQEWWLALNGALGVESPVASAIREHDGLALFALPEHYLRMIEGELQQLAASDRRKLRLLVARGTQVTPQLAPQVIRYDLRLQRLPGAPRGAMTSFAQRALLHFASLATQHPNVTSIASQRALVEAALALAPAQNLQRAQPMSDPNIKAWMRRTDPDLRASKSALLRLFRESGNACASHRFDRLHQDLRSAA